jgi:hypothetical protein
MGSRCQGCTATPTAPRRLQPRKAKQRRHLRTQMASPSRQWRRPPGADPAPADAPAAKKKSKGRGTALEAARNKLAAAEAKLETLKARVAARRHELSVASAKKKPVLTVRASGAKWRQRRAAANGVRCAAAVTRCACAVWSWRHVS